MTIDSNYNNPPNPIKAHAGSTPDTDFFRALSETLNHAHKHNNLHIYSQGWVGAAFRVDTTSSSNLIYSLRVPLCSTAHDKIKVMYRAYHSQSGSSSGSLYVRVLEENSSTALATTTLTLDNVAFNSVVLRSAALDISGTSFTHNTRYVTIQIGLNAITAGTSTLNDIAFSWQPLTAAVPARTKNGMSAGTELIMPVSREACLTNEPLSSALGYIFGTTASALYGRPRLAVAAAALDLHSGLQGSGAEYLPPYVRPHILRVLDSSKPVTLKYFIKAENIASSGTKSFRVQAIDVNTLFNSADEANHFSTSADRAEGVEHTIGAGQTLTFESTLTLEPPFQSIRGIADGSFVAVAVASRAMAPRAPMRYNDGVDFDGDVRLLSYNLWVYNV